jgi:hypothetical protein
LSKNLNILFCNKNNAPRKMLAVGLPMALFVMKHLKWHSSGKK